MLKLTILHGLLYILVVIYLFVGAYLFHSIEGSNERSQLVGHLKSRENLRQEFDELVEAVVSYEKAETLRARARISNFIRKLEKSQISVAELPLSEARVPPQTFSWTIPDCMLFTFTIVSTIGQPLHFSCLAVLTIMILLPIQYIKRLLKRMIFVHCSNHFRIWKHRANDRKRKTARHVLWHNWNSSVSHCACRYQQVYSKITLLRGSKFNCCRP